jgi:signal transduction histidine kinase
MILGLNLLALVVIGVATLFVFLMQRQAALRMHESTARQARAAVQLSLDQLEQAVIFAGETVQDEADLERLQKAYPALQAASLIDENGDEIAHVGEDFPTPETATIQYDPLTITAPSGSGRLVTWFDPETLWADIVQPVMGHAGYVYITQDGHQLVAINPDHIDSDQWPPETTPNDSLALYDGAAGELVLGRAEHVPGTPLIIVTETPLSDYTVPLALTLGLWLLALVGTFLVGEWLIQRILRTVVRPLAILHQGASAVGGGDYRYRIRMPADADQELADLGRVFNDMIERLQQSQEQINAYTHEMEEIVDLRARELSRKALQLEVAAEVSSKIATILDPRGLMRDVAELIQTRFKVYFVEILLIDEQEGILRSGNEKRNVQPIKISETSTSVIAWVARSGEPLYVPDVNEEPRYRRCPNIPASQCELAIPLKFGGKAIGVLNLEADHRDAFPKDEIAVLESLANEIAVSMHNAQVFDALQNANRDLAQATMQAKQANMLKSRFLLNASHKLRTPLNAIIGYSETMLSGVYGDFSETVIDRQQRILENGRHLLELIEDMFDLSSIESGNVELRLDAVAIKPLLEEVINASRAVMQTGYPDHQLNLRLDIADTLPPLWADLDRTRYILINLMSNAVKFTPSGEVTLSAVSENDQIVIRVKDTGPGIPDDELAVLFEPFQQERGSTASEGKGTGLGLPVSRMLAQLQGGDLTVETKLNQGSTFTLRLPCRKS